MPLDPPPADSSHTAEVGSNPSARSTTLWGVIHSTSPASAGLFLLAAIYTLYFARSFLLPIVLAGMLALLLEPLVRGLRRALRIPVPLGAGLVLFAFLGGLGFGVYELAQPAYDWVEKAPQSFKKIERRLRDLKKPVQTLGKATEQVEKITQVGSATTDPRVIAVKPPSLGRRLADRATGIAASAAIMLILVFFLLASGDLFLRKLIKVLPRAESKQRAADIARKVQGEISTYLTTVTFINSGLGLATGLAMWAIGLPNPVLWGVMVAVANYIPYLGAGLCYVVFAMVGLLTFDTLGEALVPVGAFLVLNVIEAYLISPLVLGRRLTLNPVVIFLSLTFWTWLWGISGAILAVPITSVLKILCDHSSRFAAVGEFLGE